jgi:hypothetical protein
LENQAGLSLSGQPLIDASNYDQMREYQEEGGSLDALDDEATSRWAEPRAAGALAGRGSGGTHGYFARGGKMVATTAVVNSPRLLR